MTVGSETNDSGEDGEEGRRTSREDHRSGRGGADPSGSRPHTPESGWKSFLRFDGKAAATATICSVVVVALGAAVVLSVASPTAGAESAVNDFAVGGQQPMATADVVPTSASDPTWESVPVRSVDLQPQEMAVPYGGGSVDELDVQAITNDTHVGFRLSWPDPTNDTSIAAANEYSDAAAVMLHGGEQPPIMMGANGTPVNIWYWRASWAFRSPPEGGDMYAYPHPDNRTRPGVAAGNPLSVDTFERGAQNYYAEGYGSLSHADAQNVVADAERTDDGWTVTFLRERSTAGEYDADFEAADEMYLAYAVWNGSEGEVNGQKSITLQFSTLDTGTGELSAPGEGGAGGDGGDGGGADGSAGEDGGSGGGFGLPPTSLVFVALLAIALATWIGVYRERSGD